MLELDLEEALLSEFLQRVKPVLKLYLPTINIFDIPSLTYAVDE